MTTTGLPQYVTLDYGRMARAVAKGVFYGLCLFSIVAYFVAAFGQALLQNIMQRGG